MDKDLYHKAVYIWRGGLRCCQVQKGTFWKMKLQSIPSRHQKLFLWRLQKNRKLLLWQKLRLMWLVRATYLLQSMFQHSSSWSLNSAMLIPCTSTLCHGKLLTPCAKNKICSQYVLWMWCEGSTRILQKNSIELVVFTGTCNFSFQGWKLPTSLQTLILVSAHWMISSHICCTAILHAACFKRTSCC